MNPMIVLDVNDPRWLALVERSPAATAFHHPSWSNLLTATYGYRSFAVALQDDSADIVAGVPAMELAVPFRGRRWVSLPFTDACPLLAEGDVARRELVTGLAAARRSAGIRRLDVRAELPDDLARNRSTAVTHELALESDARAVFRRFRPSQVQRNIRRAEREGVQIRRADSRRDVSELFYALHVTTRRRQGVPVQPRRFFALLWDLVIDRGLGFVSLAHKHGRTVAGAVFLVWNKTIIYKYGASDAGYWSLRPNHLIFWDAIEWACENDMQTFDLGRTDFENEGLRRFKSGWGATESPLVYATIGEAPRDGSRRHATALMRPVLTHGPPWLCRAIGALLYRYAGS